MGEIARGIIWEVNEEIVEEIFEGIPEKQAGAIRYWFSGGIPRKMPKGVPGKIFLEILGEMNNEKS